MDIRGFFKSVALSVYPISYHDFCKKSSGQVACYFLGLVLLGMLIVNLLLLPFYVGLPDLVSDSLEKFTKFNVSNDVEMSGPIEIPKKEARLVVDTTGTIKEMENERVIITGDHIYYRPVFTNKRVSFDKLLDIVNYRTDAAWTIIGFIALILPSLIFYAYSMLLLKYFILIFLSTFLLYFIVRVLMLYEISFSNAMRSAFYAGTLMVLVEALLFPINSALLVPLFSVLGMTYYLVSHLLFIVFGIIGMVVVEKDIHVKKKRHKEG